MIKLKSVNSLNPVLKMLAINNFFKSNSYLVIKPAKNMVSTFCKDCYQY